MSSSTNYFYGFKTLFPQSIPLNGKGKEQKVTSNKTLVQYFLIVESKLQKPTLSVEISRNLEWLGITPAKKIKNQRPSGENLDRKGAFSRHTGTVVVTTSSY